MNLNCSAYCRTGCCLALDLVDNDLLAGMETIDLSIIGELRLDSIDHICADISDLTGGFVWGIGKGLLGDLGDLDFSPIKNKSRSQGDLNMIMNVLTLVGNDNNSNIISKIAYGLGTSDGISLGLVGNFLDLGFASSSTTLHDLYFRYFLKFTNIKKTIESWFLCDFGNSFVYF